VSAFLVLAGEFRIIGAQPDGDSIRFYPYDPSQWDDVGGPYPVQRNASGGAQLRFDAVDALETHYAIPTGMVHQPLDLAHAARDAFLRWLGFTSVTHEGETVTAAEPAAVRGYVLTRSADKYGRCISFAGRGNPPAPSAGRFTSTRSCCGSAQTTVCCSGGSPTRPTTASCFRTCEQSSPRR
jgi:hypothetical protein